MEQSKGLVTHVVALSSYNYAIGKANTLPWHIPEDLSHFKEVTSKSNIPVIIGRNTFLSILPYCKENQFLPGRNVIVVCSEGTTLELHKKYSFNNVGFSTKKEVDEYLEDGNNIIIAGGSMLYSAYYPDVVHATLVDVFVENADAFYPFELDDSKLVQKSSSKFVDGSINFSFCKYILNK